MPCLNLKKMRKARGNIHIYGFIRHRPSIHSSAKSRNESGRRQIFSAQFCNDMMRAEYFKTNDLSQDEVCKLFGQKWQRRPALLKKQLQRGQRVLQWKPGRDDEDVFLEAFLGEMAYVRALVTAWNEAVVGQESGLFGWIYHWQYEAWTGRLLQRKSGDDDPRGRRQFVAYYNENNDEITKTAFLRHFSEKWHMSEHPLLRRLEEWIGKDYTFSTEYCTAKMTRQMLG